MFRFLAASLLAVVAVTDLARAEDPKPIKVLWCTGGGFHDYKGLQPVLTKAIQKPIRRCPSRSRLRPIPRSGPRRVLPTSTT